VQRKRLNAQVAPKAGACIEAPQEILKCALRESLPTQECDCRVWTNYNTPLGELVRSSWSCFQRPALSIVENAQ